MIALSSEERLERLREMVRKERLTDIIITDYECDACFLRQLLREKKSMGIRNVIVLHVPVSGDFAFPWDKLDCMINYRRMKEVPGAVFLEDLLEKYREHERILSDGNVDETAFIIHTSGTTEGVPKSVPLSDSAVNETLRRHTVSGKTAPEGTRMRSMVFNNMFTGASFMGMLTPLANGGVLTVLPTVNPLLNLFCAAEYYHLTNIVFFSALTDLISMLPMMMITKSTIEAVLAVLNLKEPVKP